jgi:hypothetical protein
MSYNNKLAYSGIGLFILGIITSAITMYYVFNPPTSNTRLIVVGICTFVLLGSSIGLGIMWWQKNKPVRQQRELVATGRRLVNRQEQTPAYHTEQNIKNGFHPDQQF